MLDKVKKIQRQIISLEDDIECLTKTGGRCYCQHLFDKIAKLKKELRKFGIK